MKFLWVGLVVFLVLPVHGQGVLSPAGPPAPGMKTLAQVEPRTPISSASYAIGEPGSYYLVTNLTDTLKIGVNNVTIDLMGFTIFGVTGDALDISGSANNLVIRNGTLSAPAGSGVDFSAATDGVLENLRAQNCQGHGFSLGAGFVVRNCEASGNGQAGFYVSGNSEIKDCRSTGNARGIELVGTGATLSGNVVMDNIDNYELLAGNQLNLLISQIPENLEWPCSAKLAGTLTCAQTGVHGITVSASDVTIDLAGHGLVGPGLGGSGIFQSSAHKKLSVLNGFLRNWGFGIQTFGSGARIDRVHVSECPVYGIFVADGGIITGCIAEKNGAYGISADRGSTVQGCTSRTNALGIWGGSGVIIKDCIVQFNTFEGIKVGYGAIIANCTAENNRSNGIVVTTGGHISDCTSYGNRGNGFVAELGSVIRGCSGYNNKVDGFRVGGTLLTGCTAQYNSGNGISLESQCDVSGCLASENGFSGWGAGIQISGTGNRVDQNSVFANDRGVEINASPNIITRNTARQNTDLNYANLAGSHFGPVQTNYVGAGAWDNFSF